MTARAEVVAVGTELLLGQIANSNAQTISQELASVGVGVYRHTTVGDNHERIVEALRDAAARADVVIITGGLGPTPDDITREALAEVAGRPLHTDPQLVEQITAIFEKLGRQMPRENERQAALPDGAHAIPPEGTAPGIVLDHDGTVFIALPGVPWEMRAMLSKTVLPMLRERFDAGVILSRQILVVGLGESHTYERVRAVVDEQTNPTIAFLASKGQVRLRMTARGGSESEALALIKPVDERLREALGDAAVDEDGDSIAEALGQLLRSRGLTIATAESLTGGMIAQELSERKGSSDFFLGGFVTYATRSKAEVAGVDEAILSGPGAVSAETAEALAEAAARRFSASLGISATGVAGPAEQEGKPVGLVYLGAWFEGQKHVRKIMAHGDRANIRGTAATAALDLGRRAILRRT